MRDGRFAAASSGGSIHITALITDPSSPDLRRRPSQVRLGLASTLALLTAGCLSLAGCGALDYSSRLDKEEALVAGLRPGGADLLLPPKESLARGEQEEAAEAALSGAPTLERVVEIALRRNPSLHATLERWAEALGRPAQASSYAFPTLTYRSSRVVRLHGVSLTQVVPFPGKLTLQGEVALELAGAARYDYAAQRNTLRALAANLYYGLYLRRQERRILQDNVELLARFVEISRALYAAGLVEQADVLKAEVERSTLRAEEARVAGEVRAAVAALNTLLDRSTVAPVGSVSDPEPKAGGEDLEALFAQALDQRPEIDAALSRAASADAAVSRARLSYLPDFVFGGGYSRSRRLDSGGGTAQVGVILPIWLGRIAGEVDEAKARARRTRFEIEGVRNQVLQEVEQAAARQEAARQRIRILEEEAVPQARQAIDVSEAAYQAGKIEFLSLIDAERLLLAAELARYRALADYGARTADLERAIGRPQEATE
ncbi:MAG: TolC family protein [Planctomycetes bacterium]|nr:TolC family protein [Planctomycetota bacterium]